MTAESTDLLYLQRGTGANSSKKGTPSCVVEGGLIDGMNALGMLPVGTLSQATAPVDTNIYWVDQSTEPHVLKYHNGTAWVAVTFEVLWERFFLLSVDDVATLVADTDTSKYTENRYVQTRKEGFRYQVAAAAAVDHHVTTAGGVKLYVQPDASGWVNIAAFNPAANGADVTPTDDFSKFEDALSVGPVFVPNGDYYIASRLVITNNRLRGENGNTTKIYSGTALGEFALELISSERGGSIENLSLEATVDGQNGLLLSGAALCECKQVFVNNFTSVSVQLGDAANGKGIYWSKSLGVRIRLDPAKNGTTGLMIDGQLIPSSNDNSLEDVVIGGNFVNSLHIKGNGNTVKNGTIELTRGDENVVSLIKIEGAGNRVQDMYVEPVGTPPDTIAELTSSSVGNELGVWPQFDFNNNVDASVTDDGSHNKVKFKSRGDGTKIGPFAEPSVNLLQNPGFNVWRDANNPHAWIFASARVSRVAPGAAGEPTVLRMTEAATNSTIQYYLNDYFSTTSRATPYDLTYFQGRPVIAGVWCRTSIAGAGGIKIGNLGGLSTSVGEDSHSGSGDWELLTAHRQVPTASTRLFVELRSHIANAAITGDVDFRDPFFIIGTDIPYGMDKPLTEAGARMYGDLEFPLDFSDKALGGVINLNGSYLWVSTTGSLRIATTRPTDGNWDTHGVVVGTQT